MQHTSVYLRSAFNMEALTETVTHFAPKLVISAGANTTERRYELRRSKKNIALHHSGDRQPRPE